MATMNISLPDPLKAWAEQQAISGKYSNTSDYVRDLIRKDQGQAEKIAHMQSLVDQGLSSSYGAKTMKELKEVAKKASSEGSGR